MRIGPMPSTSGDALGSSPFCKGASGRLEACVTRGRLEDCVTGAPRAERKEPVSMSAIEADHSEASTTPNGAGLPVVRSVAGGFLMGLANLVPGVSGGTMIVVTGLYDEFITSIADVTRLRFSRRNVTFLAIVGAAASRGDSRIRRNSQPGSCASSRPDVLALYWDDPRRGTPSLGHARQGE